MLTLRKIMDGKMDSGYVPPGDTFEADFDPSQELDAEHVLWIMDQLLCMEIAWHGGYPLSQTVFASLHIDRLLSPDNRHPYTFRHGEDLPASDSQKAQLVHLVLRAYCIALVKCCQQVLQMIQSHNFYEEEDFVTHLYGRELLPKTEAVDACRLLEDAVALVERNGRPDPVMRAIQTQLQFRRMFLVHLTEGGAWVGLRDELHEIDKNHKLGAPLPEAFSDKVQRQLATSTPPRPMLKISWETAITDWTAMCSDIAHAIRLTEFPVLKSPHCLQRATWAFAYREPQPNTFARANMQDILFGSDKIMGEISHFDLLLTDIHDVSLAGHDLADLETFQVELPTDPRHQCARLLEGFMDKAFDEYLNLYRMVCQNRCRIRRTFTQAIPIWDGIETEASKIDDELNQIAPIAIPIVKGSEKFTTPLHPLKNWARYHRLTIMAWTVQLGFETDIYLTDELCSMYWFLSDLYLQRTAVFQLVNIYSIEKLKNATPAWAAHHSEVCVDAMNWRTSLIALGNVSRTMALALWKLYSLLISVCIIKAPKRDFADDRLLYEARMKPWLKVASEPIKSLEHFQQAETYVKSVEDTCKAMDVDLKATKFQLASLKKSTPVEAKFVGTEEQWKEELKQLEKTCVGIAVQASQLLMICDKHGKKSAGQGDDLSRILEVSIPAVGKRYHDWWIVPQLKERKS